MRNVSHTRQESPGFSRGEEVNDWLIDIIPQACPPDVMDAPEAYRAAWGRYVGEAVPGDGDPEDWREQAARLEAATRILPDPHVRVAGRPYGGRIR
jgi:hypothetical protein